MARRKQSRREFLQTTAASGLGFWVAGGLTLADSKSPNDKVSFACIGVGGKGGSDTDHVGRLGNMVALCDCDDNSLNRMAERFPKAKKFNDYRKMLDEVGKEIDAVTVSTADHTHAPASIMAMKMKKHVYCQKPLTHTVYEARQMREIAKQMGVATQMGNQGSAANGLRRAVELIQSGIIGPITEAHVWTNRPIWPQAPQVMSRPPEEPIPPHVHWDEFLGPAPARPYGKGYHPFAWRGWWDFGTGALGDMACHTANMAFRALKLGYPTSVVADATDVNPETYPSSAKVTYQFPSRDDMPALTLTWYEGKRDNKKLLPPEELVQKAISIDTNPRRKGKLVDSGSILVGAKGILYSPDDYGAEFFLSPAKDFEGLNKTKPEKLPINNREDFGMKEEWVKAMKGGDPAYSNFDFAAMLTETILLGNVAIRLNGERLAWDGPNLKFPDNAKANQYLHYEYRKGWTL